MAGKATHLTLVEKTPSQALDRDQAPRATVANDNGTARRRPKQVYCPPAPAGDLVYRTFRQLFWGAAHLVLVAPDPAEVGR